MIYNKKVITMKNSISLEKIISQFFVTRYLSMAFDIMEASFSLFL